MPFRPLQDDCSVITPLSSSEWAMSTLVDIYPIDVGPLRLLLRLIEIN